MNLMNEDLPEGTRWREMPPGKARTKTMEKSIVDEAKVSILLILSKLFVDFR